jgi:predicted methyltransferase
MESRTESLAQSGDLALASGMTSRRLGLIGFGSLLTLAIGCAADPLPPPPPPPPPPPVVVAPPPPPPPPEPTPEEKKKAEDLQKLQDARAKLDRDTQAEQARWTPEMRAAATALAGKSWPTGHAAIKAAMAGTHRHAGNADRDKYRHPLETLDFFGFKPTMTVVEFAPGEGWYTELLAPALAKSGKLYLPTSDPNGPADQQSTLSGQRFKAFLDSSPEIYGKTQTIVVDNKAPQLGLDKTADLVLLIREVHGFYNSKTLNPWLAEAWKALKPNGVLGVVQHRAPVGSNPDETSKNGYVPEKWVIAQVEAAGFKLVGKSEINANPKDTKDYPEGVWSLPPTYREKDVNRAKYAAIGESDRMTLKFVKVAAKKP